MRIFLHLIGLAVLAGVWVSCGVKGDPKPYVEADKQANKIPATPPAKSNEGQK